MYRRVLEPGAGWNPELERGARTLSWNPELEPGEFLCGLLQIRRVSLSQRAEVA